MSLSVNKIIVLVSIFIMVIALRIWDSNRLSIEHVRPDQLGLKMNYSYKYENNVPQIKIRWEWAEGTLKVQNTHDLIGITWDQTEQWISSVDAFEGGGGPSLFAIEQMKQEGQGISFTAKPAYKDDNITFRLLPSPPNTTPKPPEQITIFFIHTKQSLTGKTTLQVIKERLN